MRVTGLHFEESHRRCKGRMGVKERGSREVEWEERAVRIQGQLL